MTARGPPEARPPHTGGGSFSLWGAYANSDRPAMTGNGNGFSLLSRIGAFLGQYKLIWYILVAVLLAMGFDFKTPAAQFTAMRQANATTVARIDSVVRSLGTRDLINIGIARYLCFKDRDSAGLFLPCGYLNATEGNR